MSARQQWYAYSPITQRPKTRWPNGKRLAVYVALGLEEYAFGEGLTENLIPGASHPDMANTAWRDYGNRVGGFRLIERLKRFGIQPTILLNTDVYHTSPAITDAARNAGAEFVAHGLSNSDTLATMEPGEEALYIRKVAEEIASRERKAPLGWSSPWLAHSPTTLDNLHAEGIRYLLDLRLDDQPVWLTTTHGKLLSIPYALEINDSSTMIGRQTAAGDFTAMIVDEFDELLEASEDRALVMSIVVHSFISGQPFRLKALTRALEHISRHSDDIWFTTPAEIADAFTEFPDFTVK
jgi:peptidoglycan/xylan/chitin deacetylase (PgdA/CDA1 family)